MRRSRRVRGDLSGADARLTPLRSRNQLLRRPWLLFAAGFALALPAAGAVRGDAARFPGDAAADAARNAGGVAGGDSTGHATGHATGNATGHPAGDATADLAAAETAGAQLLFDYDFDRAAAHYLEVSERFPEHPSGPYNVAAVIWNRLAQRSNGMRGSSLRNDRYFHQQGRSEATPAEEADFRLQLEESYRRAERLLAEDPDHLEALYYLGATEALESGWSVIVDRAWFRAARQIRRGVRRHRRIQELDPAFRDAYAVPGAYEYGIATLPRPLRWLAVVFRIRADRENGLSGLATTANEGRRARWGALWTTSLLMQREGRDDEALAAARRLVRQFPKNPDFALEEVSILTAKGDFEAARDLAGRVLERRAAGFGNYGLALPGLAETRLGEALLFAEEWAEAEAAFTRGLAAGPNPEIRSLLRFRRGNARDGLGRRPEALADYRVVAATGADEVLREWARDLLRAPWPQAAPEGTLPDLLATP